jgi:Spy/CpxP family protein refolding chaperone
MRFQTRRLALMAAAVFTVSTAAAVAVAQEGPPPPGMPPMADDGPGGPGGGPGGPPMMRHRFDPEAHAQHLRDVLQLRPDQDGALKTFIAATSPKPRGDKGGPGEGQGPKPGEAPPKRLTTPERLDRETEFLAHAKARIDATKAFYAALSPSQQKAFDALGPQVGFGHDGPGPMMRRAAFRHGKDAHRGPAPAGAPDVAKRKAS